MYKSACNSARRWGDRAMSSNSQPRSASWRWTSSAIPEVAPSTTIFLRLLLLSSLAFEALLSGEDTVVVVAIFSALPSRAAKKMTTSWAQCTEQRRAIEGTKFQTSRGSCVRLLRDRALRHFVVRPHQETA